MLRTFGYTLLGLAIFFTAGFLIYKLGLAPYLQSFHFLLSGFIAVLLVSFYCLCGGAAGLLLALTGAIMRKVESLETNVQKFLAPRMEKLVAKIPLGREGMAIEDFKRLLTEGVWLEQAGRDSNSPTLFSSLKIFSRFMMRRLLQAMRLVFLNDFIEELQAQGETRVNVANVERFGRESLVSLALDYLRTPVLLVRVVTFIIATLLLAPAIWVVVGFLRAS